MKNRSNLIILLGLLILSLFSCSTLQKDVEVYTTFEEKSPEIMEAEKELVFLEVENLLKPNSVTAEQADKIIKKIDILLGDVNIQTAIQAKLFAFQGRLFLISNRKDLAKDYYQQANSTYKGEVQNVILGSRLGLVEDLEQQKVAKEQMAFLTLEAGIIAYEQEDYLQAVAKFDEAFLTLDSFYREAYEPLRNNAWKLRNLATELVGNEIDVLKQNSMTVSEMLVFTKNTTDLLFNHTASKKYSKDSLFSEILKAGLLTGLNFSKTTIQQELSSDDILTRIIAARFLWNLYLEKRGMAGEVKYADVFIEAGFSPILDLPLDSPDFDAVLGCVENEIMELPDGENFFPEDPIEPLDFNESLKKLK